MTDLHWSVICLTGIVLGVFVGMVGTSGAIIIPVLVYFFGLTQLRAQGTSLFIACIPLWWGPLAPYARSHNVDWRLGALLAGGLAVGGFAGGSIAQHLPVVFLRRGFALVLAVLAVRMFFQR